jgi:hypothetical protein
MTIDQQTASVQGILWELADPDTGYFNRTFERLRNLFPEMATEACLYYLAEKGLNASGKVMAAWLSLDDKYLTPLLDEAGLPLAVANKAVAELSKADSGIFVKFLEAAERISVPERMMRPLSLVPALADYTALLPWLGKLTKFSDSRVRSRAAKLLYALHHDSSEIKKQIQDNSARVRANVLESLWKSKSPETADLFKAALSDANHRVVGNALIGLYLQGDFSALDRLIELSTSADASFRAAVAWSLGFIGDGLGIPELKRLSLDQSLNVRKHAISSLVLLEREAWQRAVRQQFESLREGRAANIAPLALDELEHRHTLLIDVAFRKLQAAEEHELDFAAAHADQFARHMYTF